MIPSRHGSRFPSDDTPPPTPSPSINPGSQNFSPMEALNRVRSSGAARRPFQASAMSPLPPIAEKTKEVAAFLFRPLTPCEEDSSIDSPNAGPEELPPPLTGARPEEPPKLLTGLAGHIAEQSALFKKSMQVTKSSEILLPLDSDNANDVYIGDNFVFKPGKEAWVRNQICYGLARIIGVTQPLVPSKRGTATIIASIDLDDNNQPKDYRQLLSSTDKPLLVEYTKKALPISSVKVTNEEGLTCKIKSKSFVLPSHQFELLKTDDETPYLVPTSQVYPLMEKKGQEYVKIKGYYYLVKEDQLLATDQYSKTKDQKVDQQLLKQTFTRLNKEDLDPNSEDLEEVLVPPSAIFPITKKEASRFLRIKSIQADQDYAININPPKKSAKDEDSSDDKKDNALFVLVHDSIGSHFLVRKKDQEEITVEGESSYVMRDGGKHEIVPTVNASGDVTQRVIGKNIYGMIQEKIENLYTDLDAKGKPLDIRSPSTQREEFYSRIDMESLIEAFITGILIRPQDGKLIALDQSNILFSIDPSTNKLKTVWIDLDETLPDNNQYSTDSEYKPKTHIVRNGLMALPQTHSPLSPPEKAQTLVLIQRIIDKKEVIESYLDSLYLSEETEGTKRIIGIKGIRRIKETEEFEEFCIFGDKHKNATLEVIDRLEHFVAEKKDSEWSLATLFFTIFPEYKEQWDKLGTETNEMKASRIGAESEKSLTMERP